MWRNYVYAHDTLLQIIRSVCLCVQYNCSPSPPCVSPHNTHTLSLSLQEGYTPTPTCSYLCLAQLLQEEPTMISRSTPSHCHTLTSDFELGGKNKWLLEMYGSTVWHGCVSEYACMCDYIFHTRKRRALLVSTSTCPTLHMYT